MRCITVLNPDIVDRRALCNLQLDHRIRELAARQVRQVDFDNFGATLFVGFEKQPRLGDGARRIVEAQYCERFAQSVLGWD